MTSPRRHHIEGFPGCTITRDRQVFSAFGRKLKITLKKGKETAVLGSLKSGTRTTVSLDAIWQRAFEPGAIKTKATMHPAQLHRANRDAAWQAANGNLAINTMMDDLRNGVKARGKKVRLSLNGAAEILAKIGQEREFREWTR